MSASYSNTKCQDMKTKSSILGLLTLLHLLLLLSLSDSYKDFMDLGVSSIVFTYKRVAEIEQHCSPFLSLASKLSPDDNRGYRLRKELSFAYGDWEQENGGSPLMPFDESDLLWSSLPQTAPLKLVSFQVKDINSVHHFENSVTIGGILSIGITRNDSYFIIPQSSPFYMRPGLSVLTIVFEGVYLESEESGGENLMCLLGNTTLPLSEPRGDYWDLANSHVSDYNLLQDDQILVVLRYPQTFNLTRRAIKGEMRSLNEGGSLKNFDDVHISSQLSHYSKYQFSSELTSRACDLHPYQEEMTEDGVTAFNGSEFCKTLPRVSEEAFNLFPNYKFSDRDAHQSKLGPFQPGKEINSANGWWDYEDFKLVLQHLICEEETTKARISVVLRVFPASIPVYTARVRTGLSSITLSAEGTWDSSSGQLCMIGCPGVVDSGIEGCNSQISLYFPRVFSIKQRSIILGSISSIINESDQFLPLLFDSARYPLDLYPSLGLHSASYPSYNYSKIKQATAIRDRNQPSKAFTLLKQIFLKYPALEDGQDTLAQLGHLSTNLNFNSYAFRHQSSDLYYSRIFIRMEVLSLGPLFGRYMPSLYDNNQVKTPGGTEMQKLTNSQFLNISVHLMYEYFTERPSVFAATYYRDFSPLFLEGVYDPLTGDMHLIGCRKVRDGRINLERGFDCHVEAKVHYPSETGRWLKNPSVEITISSQRNEDDPLHFSHIDFRAYMIPYGKHRHDVAFRKLFEGVLRILISLVAVGIISSQLLYMNKNADFIPYISLVMLAQQILGYSAELIRATEILLESKESVSRRNNPYDLKEYTLFIKALKFLARFLVLSALLITARLYQKASEARNRPNAYGSNKPKRIPHYKHVILRHLKIHIGVCLVVLGLRYIEIFFRNDLQLMDAFVLLGVLMRQVETQVLWAQDFFLLPQIVDNSLWQSQVKPLRKLYYVGLTLLRLILYFYDYIRDPVSELYSDEGVFNQVDSDFLSISGIIAAPIIMIVLTIIVHIQQSLNYLKLASRQVQNS